MPERERAESLSLEEERHDPDALYRILKGGFSSGSGRRYRGLGEQILERITEIYAAPAPQGYSSDTRYKGEERWAPKGRSHEADALELGMRLRAWLADPIPDESKILRDDLMGLARRATENALAMVKTRRRGGVPITFRAKVLELVRIYLEWLGRSCDHKRAHSKGPVRECPDCGAVTVDI